MTNPKTIPAFKCVRPDGTDFRTGTLNYAAAIAEGRAVEVLDAAKPNGEVCGHGIHVSPTARLTIRFASSSHRPWRWFEGTVRADDVIEKDKEKMRVRRFTPTKELSLADIFGEDFAKRIELAKEEAKTWKDIPWLKPTKRVAKSQVESLIQAWRDALNPFIANGVTLPDKVRIVTTAAAADAAAADADAAAAAAAAAAADAAAAAAAAAAFSRWRYRRWYVRPYYVLWRWARWEIAGLEGSNPWKPMMDLYRLGCLPVGFVKDEFVVWVPKVVKA